MHHAQIAQRAFNTPLMVDPAKALAFLSGLGPRITGQEITLQGLEVDASDQAAAALPARASLFGNDLAQRHQRNGTQPFAMVDGIAVIEIAGTLVHRGAWIGQSSGLTSYEGIAAQLQAALADPGVRGIALDIDSFGGEVAGAFDLADRIRAARTQKPVQAFVAEHALSAGYVLASQTDRIILPRTGAVGSIGVVALHTDMSGALDQKGLSVTLIHAGVHKIDANPYQPLPEAVHDQMQRELEVVRFLFAETVAAGRGNRLSHAAALATEAAVFRGADAIAAGLADDLADPVTAFHAFAAAPRGTIPSSRKGLQMTTTSTDAPSDTPNPAHISAAPAATATVAAAPEIPAAVGDAVPTTMTADAIRAEAAEVAQVCAQAARLSDRWPRRDRLQQGRKPDPPDCPQSQECALRRSRRRRHRLGMTAHFLNCDFCKGCSCAKGNTDEYPSGVTRMNAVRPIAVKLDQDTRDRLKRLADAKDRSTHWMLREAVAQFVEREEKREAFRQAGLQAWEEFQATGKHITHDEADAWLARLEAGEEAAAPECHD